MSTSPLPPDTTPAPLGISLAQAMKLPGWLVISRAAGIIGNLPTRDACQAAFGHISDAEFLPTHIFQEPLPEERTGTRILHGYFELKAARSLPEAPRAATARLPVRLRVLLAGVAEISSQPDMRGHAPVWALAYWTTTSESAVLADLRTLKDRRLVDFRIGHEPEAWLTPFGRQVTRLVSTWRLPNAR